MLCEPDATDDDRPTAPSNFLKQCLTCDKIGNTVGIHDAMKMDKTILIVSPLALLLAKNMCTSEVHTCVIAEHLSLSLSIASKH